MTPPEQQDRPPQAGSNLRHPARGPNGASSLNDDGAPYGIEGSPCCRARSPSLAVTGLVSGSGGLVTGVTAFVAYGIGMGLVVGLLAMLVALPQDAVVRRSRAVTPYVSRISGAPPIRAGGHIACYGWYEARVFAGGDADDPIAGAATALPGRVAVWIDTVGAGWIAAVFLVTVVAALVRSRARRAGHFAAEKGKRR
jgi:hypothetical protein